MRGLAHFVTGVAIATFFPQVVQGAAGNLSFGPLLGGLAGLLPDTLDFKLLRYVDRVDLRIDPAVLCDQTGNPDPQAMAESLAGAMNRAYDTGRQVKVHVPTQKLGADRWQQYSVTFDPEQTQVEVDIGPVVTTGQVPVPGYSPDHRRTGKASVNAPIQHTYDDEINIDIFHGPTFAFERAGQHIQVTFLPWHRAWTHSLLMALFLGLLGALVSPVYGLVMALAVVAHAISDQLGYMGCNLLVPLTRKRTTGLGLFHSSDSVVNLVAVWLGVALIFFNLDRFSKTPSLRGIPYVLGIIILPTLVLVAVGTWSRWQARRKPEEDPYHSRHDLAHGETKLPSGRPLLPAAALAAVEALDEADEVDI